MVDAVVAAKAPAGIARAATRAETTSFRIIEDAASAEAVAACEALVPRAVAAPAQGLAWIRAWRETVRPDSIAVLIVDDGRPVFLLALEIVGKGPCKVARFIGETHANGNFVMADRTWLAGGAASAAMPGLIAAIAAARPDIDVVALERLLPDYEGIANPLLALPHAKSPNLSLAVDLDGGFQRVVSGPSGKRKRKKHRTQARKYEAAGGYRRIEANTGEEVDRALDAFFAMKASRFRQAGIVNVFGEADVQAFFRRLFRDALPLSPKPFVLHGLEVGGKLRAVTGSSRSGNRIICEFGSIADDEMVHASPGEYLFFDNIEEACAEGLAVYDFSVGDEPYKRLWCDIETQHLDVLLPLTLKGRLVAGSMRLFSALKSSIKNNPTIWRITKALRRRTAGQSAPEQQAADAD